MQSIKSFFFYLFYPLPGSQFKFYIPLLILALLLIVGGVIFSALYKNRKKTDFAFKRLFVKTSKRLVILGILFLLLVVVRYENIPYFSMRIWIYLSLFLLLFFAYKTAKTFKVEYPKEKENIMNKLGPITTKGEERRYTAKKNKR
jgi:L-asparagine transporter-like permease